MRSNRNKMIGFGLLCVMLISLVLAGCTTTATIKVTVKGEDGAALKDITVAVGDKNAKTDASGVATVKGVTPGQVTIKLTGTDYADEKTETVKVGNNEFSYQLQSHAWAARPFGEVAKMRIRVTTFGMEEPVTAAYVQGQGVHWTMPDGSEIVSLFDVLYVRAAGAAWQRIAAGTAGGAMAEMMAQLTNQLYGQFQAFDSQVGDNLVQAKWIGTEEVNGYNTKIFEVTWAEGTQGGTYRINVIAAGDYRGYVTRYQWNIENLGTSVYDLYDFGGALEVKAPI